MSSQDFLKPKLLVKVKELVKCSLQNEVLFEPPRVKIIFASGITKGLLYRRGLPLQACCGLNDRLHDAIR